MTKIMSMFDWMKTYSPPAAKILIDPELRQRIRMSGIPADELPSQVDRLIAAVQPLLVQRFAPKKFTIDLPGPYSLDVIVVFKRKLEKIGWTVCYDYRDDGPQYDRLIFRVPVEWLNIMLERNG